MVLLLLHSINRRLFAVIVAISSFGICAYADQKEAPTKKRSQDFRGESDILFTASPIGFYTYPGGALNVGVVLDERNTIETEYISTKSNMSGVSARLTNYVDVRWRFFIGNSFNIKAGPAYRRLKVNYSHEKVQDEYYAGVHSIASSIGPMASIGNQWQFGGFILGCDWVGFYVPFYASNEGKLHGNTSNLNSDQRSLLRQNAKKTNDESALTLLGLHMGFAF